MARSIWAEAASALKEEAQAINPISQDAQDNLDLALATMGASDPFGWRKGGGGWMWWPWWRTCANAARRCHAGGGGDAAAGAQAARRQPCFARGVHDVTLREDGSAFRWTAMLCWCA
ncbi:MAG: hypothetical protein U0636_05060 [Phycisphaerales bacterium]